MSKPPRRRSRAYNTRPDEAERARRIVCSIRLQRAAGLDRSLADYDVTPDSPLAQQITALLAQHNPTRRD